MSDQAAQPTPSIEQLARIGWQGSELPPPPEAGARLARVIAQHRGHYDVHDGNAAHAVSLEPGAAWRGTRAEQRPAVGDWVWLRCVEQRPVHLIAMLPRRTALVRGAAGEHYQRQVIASNIDTVFVVVALDERFSLPRVERYLTVVGASGAQTVVVLTRGDRLDPEELPELLDSIQSGLGDSCPVLAVDAREADTRERLLPWLGPGQTIALVGLSGAGKSTLTNTVLGEQRQRTAAVRHYDQRGRHTTTTRSLVAMPDGSCLIDTPGMRELKLSGDESLEQFDDVQALAQACRFANCRHQDEPGCAVLAAVESGELEQERLLQFLKLRDELLHASDMKRRRSGAAPASRPRHRGPRPRFGADEG